MRRFTITCQFGEQKAPVAFYIGEANSERHPLYYQAAWLKKERGGVVPPEVMDSFEKLRNIALENNVPFEDLCYYAVNNADTGQS